MKLLQLTPKVYKYYRTEVNGNSHEDFKMAQRKMTRNMKLAAKAPRGEEHSADLYMYGSLHFLVRDNTVVWIKNKCRKPKGWTLDKNKYAELNEKLFITTGKSKSDLVKKDIKYFIKRNKSKLQHKLKLVSNK